MGSILKSKFVRNVVAIVVGVAIVGGAFYGGRVYQNNEDQKLFTAYNPPQTNGSTRGSAFGGGGLQNSQIAAALTVGTPPAQNPSSVAPAANQAGSASSGSATGAGTGASTSGIGAATATGGRALAGQLVSMTAGTLTVQSFLGQASLPTTARTHYYQVTGAAPSDLKVGQMVTVSPDPADASTAASVTLAASSGLLVRVRSFGGGGSAGAGGSGGGFGTGGGGGGFGTGGGGGAGSTGGSTGAGPGGFRRSPATSGAITSLGNGTVTLRTAQGSSKTLKISSATGVFRVVEASPVQYQSGSYVAVRPATVNGRQVAADVVDSAVSGTIASIASA